MKIGYLVPEFPGQTHGFFWREITHLESDATAIEIISTRRPRDTATHAFSRIAATRTTYLADIKLLDVFQWMMAAFAALRLLTRRDVRKLRQAPEGWIKLFALGTIGARLSSISRSRGITHIHGHSCADAGYVLAFCRLAGGPSYSLSLHGDLEVYGRGHGFKFQNAKFVACVTDALRRQVRSRVPELSNDPELIRMGIDLDVVNQKGQNWSAPGSLRVVTVARLNPAKGHKHAIAAVAELVKQGHEIRYDIIGEGQYFQEIEKSIKEAGLEKNVVLIGPVANDQIAGRLAEYDAFVLPSVGLGEAAPVAVMEAMGVGIPVICSIIGGTPEMIQHGETGYLFPKGDELALTNILADLSHDPELRNRIGKAGQAHAHANFLTSVSAAALMDAIRA